MRKQDLKTIGKEDSSEVGTADKTRIVKTRTSRNISPQSTGRINWNGGKEDSSKTVPGHS